MDRIKNLILQNFILNDNDTNLVDKICDAGSSKADKLFSILQNLIKFRLDFDSIIAFIAYEQGYVLDDKTDSDILLVYNSLKSNFSINEGMTKQEQADILRKMFIAMNSDIRVIVIRLYIMLYDISQYNLPLSKEEHQNLINIREIYAPLAERLGLNSLKSELEDYCLKFLNPKTYENLASSVMLQKDVNQEQIVLTTKKLQNILDELNLNTAVIMSRQKHFSSIYKKIQSKGLSLANIYDLIAVRIVVESIEDCYAVLGKIHGIYKPMEGRFKDYIASPKPNGYQSLHTTIVAENKRPLEIQIRTFEMHKLAEFGVFAHWLYKEKKNKLSELDKKISWLREIMESSKDLSSEEFIDTLRTNLCEGQIYVQTPKGKVMEFVEGATVLDFAYMIHSDVGNTCVGAKVNGQIKPLSTKMRNGDIVEIITSQNSRGPSKDWLKIVKTASAKSKINTYFKHTLRDENIKTGIAMLEQAIKNKGYAPNKVMVDKYLNLEQFKYVFNTLDELYASIGYGSVPV
ncbi:MAG: bifunctional (p)ppGpp synthetase/guanosine-3',5'-bis(diphosphate) 3'-pyrophosphohydrolase, partial [Clostridia bacterium]|nr:bifunctional (p)ppGpp synthetase/guanosine-3',5'-bis(diphosphate) 3'-pyrophosphohydrolase [Clostridia bacterium]